jgi:hypothetical protein
MNIRKWGKYAAIPATCAAVLVAGMAVSADAASTLPANSVGSSQIRDGSIGTSDWYPGALTWVRSNPINVQYGQLSPALKAKVDAVSGGAQGPKGDTGATGATGPKGDKGDPGILSVNAMSSVTNRPDSGGHGTWATDTLTRSISITRQHATKATDCGPTATTCWFYTGMIADNGTFTTVTGADSPEAGTAISGTVVGASKIEFYATSDAPNPALVDATVNGSAHPTGQWAAMFFPAGTTVTDSDLLDWAWTYQAAATCEKWVNAKAGNTGDITGVNAC